MSVIEHRAKIIYKNSKTIMVKFIDTDACENCPIAHCCQISSKETIDIPSDLVKKADNGDEILILINENTQKMGILLYYLLPTLIIFVSLIIGKYLQASDEQNILYSFLSLIVYYGMLWMFKRFIRINMKVISVKKK